MDAVTPDYNPLMFFILKTAFIPQVVQMLQTDDYLSTLEDYQLVVRQCWAIIKARGCEVQAEELVEFLELAFNSDILNRYQLLPEG